MKILVEEEVVKYSDEADVSSEAIIVFINNNKDKMDHDGNNNLRILSKWYCVCVSVTLPKLSFANQSTGPDLNLFKCHSLQA